MQKKGLIALLVATVIVAVAAIVLSLGGTRSVAEAGSGQPVLAGLAGKIGDIASLKISGAGGTVTLQRQAPGWSVGETGSATCWQVSGTNGENAIYAEGRTQAEAWARACERARAVGIPAPPRGDEGCGRL